MRTIYQIVCINANGEHKDTRLYFKFRSFADFVGGLIEPVFGVRCWSRIINQYSDAEIQEIKEIDEPTDKPGWFWKSG